MDLEAVVAAHLAVCEDCVDEWLFARIDQAGAPSAVATMGRAVLIAHLHPEDGDEDLSRIKQAVREDVAAADDRGDPTNTWIVVNKAGQELARVHGATPEAAHRAAERIRAVRDTGRREGAYQLRRLGWHELHP